VRALASPASLKGVLSALEAAAALAEGLRRGGADAEALPVADGGEGTLDVLEAELGGEWRSATVSDPLGREVEARWLVLRDGVAAVESAQAIGLGLVAEEERDVMRASSRGLGQLIEAAVEPRPSELIVFLGGTATVDGGLGVLEVLRELPVPTRVACDVRATLLASVWVFAPQKGAHANQLGELERRLTENATLMSAAGLPGSGAAGGVGAALASLGAELVEGAPLVLDLIGFRAAARAADLVVTGEGTLDETTVLGKAPAAVYRVCEETGIRCVLFGGRVVGWEAMEVYELSGDPARAREDLVELGERLAQGLSR
jgi:glycerate 2-kinase